MIDEGIDIAEDESTDPYAEVAPTDSDIPQSTPGDTQTPVLSAHQEAVHSHPEAISLSIPIPPTATVSPKPSRPRHREKNTVATSFLISLAAHGLLFGLAFVFLVRYAPPKWHLLKGDGVSVGETGAPSQSDPQSSTEQMQLPLASVQDTSPPSLRSSTPTTPEQEVLDTVPPEFIIPPEIEQDDPSPSDLILFGATSTAMPSATPTWHSTVPAGTNSPSPELRDGIDLGVSVNGKKTTAVSASKGAAGKTLIWRNFQPAGGGGAGGHGGSRAGLDDNGWPLPKYPTESKRRGEEGTVLLQLELKADGTVGQIKVLRDGGYPRLADAAVDAARKFQFEPATYDGRPVPMTVTKPFNFSLK